jgi:hypothetical protein
MGMPFVCTVISVLYFRSYNTAFSPMALNNLNNPYSPQPSTPVASAPDDHFMSGIGGGANCGGGSVSFGGGGGGGGGAAIINSQLQQSLLVQFQGVPAIRSRHSSAESEPALRTNMSSGILDLGGGATAMDQFNTNVGLTNENGKIFAILHTLHYWRWETRMYASISSK